jgi:hypothetical protein
VRKFKMSLIQGSDDEAEDGKDGDDKYWSEWEKQFFFF